ncbi:MAG: flagellar biosynthesis protein FlhB [Candidatus Midichloria sp.]|nr:flagellar biosynthesis protein FlhB [Candidatus Midichloria sp.]
MADENQDKSERTEDPTPRRLEDARKDGKVPTSRELVSFAIFLSSTLMIIFLTKPISSKFTNLISGYLINFHLININELSIRSIAQDIVFIFLIIAIVPLILNSAVVLLTYFIQHNGFVFSTKSIGFDLSKISLLKGLQKLFSLRSIVELIKGVVKISLVGVAAYFAIRSQIKDMQLAFFLDINGIIAIAFKAVTAMMLTVCSVMFLISVIDFLYQRFEYINDLKMSFKDIKDEQKHTDGDPEIKFKQKTKRKALLKKFSTKDVAKADVIITNPTHYAIALEYNPQEMPAPKVLAKGADLMALKIREIANQYFIPIVQNPPLARALFDSTDIDDFVPLEHYKAVAEVISYVMKIRPNKKLLKGIKDLKK